MLNVNNCQIAGSFTQGLAAKKKVLAPKPTTVLSSLVGLSMPPGDFGVKSAEDLMIWSSGLNQVTQGTLENPSRHSLELDALTKQLGDLVRVHVGYAKNVVVPHVMELSKAIHEYKQNAKPREASEDFEIRVVSIPSLLKDDAFLDTLRFYQDRPIINPDKSLDLGLKTEEELMQMVLIGSAKADKLVVEWLSAQKPGTLLNIWGEFLGKRQGPEGYNREYVYGYDGIARLNNFERLNFALGLYLLARNIYDNVQESNMPLETYRNLVAQYRDYAGCVVVDALKKTALAIKTKVIVLENDNYSKVIKVNGECYGDWLEAGGSPEVILGMAVSEDKVSTAALIDGKIDEYKRRWQSYLSFYRVSQNNRFFDDMKLSILHMFQQGFNNQDEVEKEYLIKNPGHVEKCVKSAEAYLNTLKLADFDIVHELALKLVCGIRFCYNSSYQILSDIHEASKVNPDIDAREAALLAVINYVSDYMANQISISDV